MTWTTSVSIISYDARFYYSAMTLELRADLSKAGDPPVPLAAQMRGAALVRKYRPCPAKTADFRGKSVLRVEDIGVKVVILVQLLGQVGASDSRMALSSGAISKGVT